MDKVVDVLAIIIEFLSDKRNIEIIVWVSIIIIVFLHYLRSILRQITTFEECKKHFLFFSILPIGILILFIILFIFSIWKLDFSIFSKENKGTRKYISYIIGYNVFLAFPAVALDLLIDTVMKVLIMIFKKKSDD